MIASWSAHRRKILTALNSGMSVSTEIPVMSRQAGRLAGGHGGAPYERAYGNLLSAVGRLAQQVHAECT